MPKNFVMKVRMTRSQFEKVQFDAEVKGFKTMSQYMRHLALEREDGVLRKIHELHEKMLLATAQEEN